MKKYNSGTFWESVMIVDLSLSNVIQKLPCVVFAGVDAAVGSTNHCLNLIIKEFFLNNL